MAFEEENDMGIEWLRTEFILDLAQQIAVCDFFIGNQSLAYAIAAVLDVPRVLEVSPYSSTVPPNPQTINRPRIRSSWTSDLRR